MADVNAKLPLFNVIEIVFYILKWLISSSISKAQMYFTIPTVQYQYITVSGLKKTTLDKYLIQ